MVHFAMTLLQFLNNSSRSTDWWCLGFDVSKWDLLRRGMSIIPVLLLAVEIWANFHQCLVYLWSLSECYVLIVIDLIADLKHDYTLTDDFVQNHFLVGLLLTEVKSALNEIQDIRRFAITTLRSLLAKHSVDDRYSSKVCIFTTLLSDAVQLVCILSSYRLLILFIDCLFTACLCIHRCNLFHGSVSNDSSPSSVMWCTVSCVMYCFLYFVIISYFLMPLCSKWLSFKNK